MTLESFCSKLPALGLSQKELALAILWFHDEQHPDVTMSAGALAAIMTKMGLGVPHSTRLGDAIRASGYVLASARGFKLKVLSRAKIRTMLSSILAPEQPSVDQDTGFIPKPVWDNTRGYIESICRQINASYQFESFDGAAVLLRRVVETLLIECFESQGRENEIRDDKGSYLMLRDLSGVAVKPGGLSIGRNAKHALEHVKEAGDLAAHNRRYLTRKGDLDRVQTGARVLLEELIFIAKLKY